MSRHKLVRNLDLDEELDDYDGDFEYDEDNDNEGKDVFQLPNMVTGWLC